MLTTDGKLNEFGHQQWSQQESVYHSNLLEHVRLLIVIIQHPHI